MGFCYLSWYWFHPLSIQLRELILHQDKLQNKCPQFDNNSDAGHEILKRKGGLENKLDQVPEKKVNYLVY